MLLRLFLGPALVVSLFLGGLGPASAQEPLALTPVRIELAPQIPSGLPILGTVLLRPAAGAGAPVRGPVSSNAAVAARLPTGWSREVSAGVPGCWSPQHRWTVGR